jgi:hypothetical protein
VAVVANDASAATAARAVVSRERKTGARRLLESVVKRTTPTKTSGSFSAEPRAAWAARQRPKTAP